MSGDRVLASEIGASTAQQGMWVTQRETSFGRAYLMPLLVWLDGPLDAAALAHACADVARRHPLLRSVPRLTPTGLVFVVAEQPTPMSTVSLEGSMAPVGAVQAFIDRVLMQGTDVAAGPLFTFTLLRCAAARHALLVVAHHLVFDGLSKDILVNDLSEAYNLRTGTAGDSLPPLATSVGDALVELEQLELDRRAVAEEFWTQRWEVPTAPILPTFGRMPTGRDVGDMVTLSWTGQQISALSDAARMLDVSRFCVIAATVQALLGRYGNSQCTIGVNISTRLGSAEGHIGHFVNEVALVAREAERTSLRVLASAVSESVSALSPIRMIPLARAGIALAPSVSAMPVSLSYRSRRGSPVFEGLEAKVDWMLFNGVARNALHVQMVDEGDHIEVGLQFAPESMNRLAVERIGVHLTRLLAAAAADVDAEFAQLPMLPDDELAAVTTGVNGSAAPVPTSETVVELFRRTANDYPARTAVVYGSKAMTYADLDAASETAARRLRQQGVGAGTVVAIQLPRSADLVVCLLAVLRAGGAYLPVESSLPTERVGTILRDAGPALVISDADLSAGQYGIEVPCLSVADLLSPVAVGELARDLPAPAPEDLAYVIYTSGSTGVPKGVEVEHRPMANLLTAFNAMVGDRDDVWLAHTALSFDISILEIFAPLVAGGRVVMAADRQSRDGLELVTLIKNERVSHVQATPSGWLMLLNAGFDEPSTVALVGGEMLPPSLAQQLRGRVGRLVNCYGPTEACVWCTVRDLSDPAADVTIGGPIDNTTAYVLDAALQPMGLSVPGDLYIGGVALARGYRNQPELTSAAFIPHPFDASAGRLYRTGDRALVRDDGDLDCLGRTDTQVKLRGHRIELGEIEAALAAHPDLAQAAVVLHGADVAARLVAYLVQRGSSTVGDSTLRDHLAASLPDYMIPRTYVRLEVMPLNSSGKVDRKRLPEPPALSASGDSAGAELDDATVSAVAAICADALRLPAVGLHDDLFDLGMHSLIVTQIIAQLRSTMGVDVGLELIFDNATVAGIAASIHETVS